MDRHARLALAVLVAVVGAGACEAAAAADASIRAPWPMPPKCTPLAPPRIKDLKEELRRTGYRLVMAIHPAPRGGAKNPPRDLWLARADGTGLKRLTDTPDKEERVPRTSPDGSCFSYNYGDYLVDTRTLGGR